jgi:hypothetical protein
MGEAAALDVEHPMRQALERELDRLGPWAQAEWRELQTETDALRLEFRRAAISPRLEERLLRLVAAEQVCPVRQRTLAKRRIWVAGAVTAVACAVITVVHFAKAIRPAPEAAGGLVTDATVSEPYVVRTASDRPSPEPPDERIAVARSPFSDWFMREPTALLPPNNEPKWLRPRLRIPARQNESEMM